MWIDGIADYNTHHIYLKEEIITIKGAIPPLFERLFVIVCDVQTFWASSILHILLLVYDYLILILPSLIGGLSFFS